MKERGRTVLELSKSDLFFLKKKIENKVTCLTGIAHMTLLIQVVSM